MDAAMVTALAALIAGAGSAAAAMFTGRGANRTAQEGNAVTGFSSLTNELQEERKELRTELATVRAELAAEKAETARLRLMVQQLGGTP
jgi:hypothetical protein